MLSQARAFLLGFRLRLPLTLACSGRSLRSLEGRAQGGDEESIDDEEDAGVQGADEGSWDAQCFLGRYLMSLRCSYSSQFRNGLLTPPAYRKILRALKTAVDHANDKVHEHESTWPAFLPDFMRAWDAGAGDVEEMVERRGLGDQIRLSDMKFEWGWLQFEGFLDLPPWLQLVRRLTGGEASVKRKYFLGAVCIAPLIKNWTVTEVSQCMEIMLAVTRAHEDTLRCEYSLLEQAPECIQEVLHSR